MMTARVPKLELASVAEAVLESWRAADKSGPVGIVTAAAT